SSHPRPVRPRPSREPAAPREWPLHGASDNLGARPVTAEPDNSTTTGTGLTRGRVKPSRDVFTTPAHVLSRPTVAVYGPGHGRCTVGGCGGGPVSAGVAASVGPHSGCC